MDLHPEEAALSGAEDEEQEHSDQDLQIRRTVTQVLAPAPKTVFYPLQLPFITTTKVKQEEIVSVSRWLFSFLSSLRFDAAVV